MLINRDNIKFRVGVFFFIFASLIFAQETHNLEIIWEKASPESVFYFGRCIASGDVNGDSLSDIMIVGDSILDSSSDSIYRGVCWIYFGGANIDTIPDIRLKNTQRLTFWSLHPADINGDGFDDAILGACNNADGYGEVLVFLGGNVMDTICDYGIRGPMLGSIFGCSVSAGDVNGDGYKDLIVGAYGSAPRPGGYLMGQVYIYFGGPNFDTTPDIILNGGHENDQEGFGTSVAGGGDVNGDGFSDVMIGAGNFGPRLQGRVYIYFGGDPMDTTYDVAMTGEGSLQQLGLGNVGFLKNQTDYDNVITGTQFWSNGSGYQGKVYVLFGGQNMDSIPDVCMIGRTDSSGLGLSTASAGDLDNDNNEEIISTAINEPTFYAGTVYMWFGGLGFDTIPDAWIRGNIPDQGIGWEISSAGDVNDDTRDEIMVSNSASNFSQKKVWVCEYTGPGIEENHLPFLTNHLQFEIKPNPCTWYTAIRYLLPSESRVSIIVYDITGKSIKTICENQNVHESGNYKRRWDLRDDNQKMLSAGIYFIEITINKEKEIHNWCLRKTNKIMVVK